MRSNRAKWEQQEESLQSHPMSYQRYVISFGSSGQVCKVAGPELPSYYSSRFQKLWGDSWEAGRGKWGCKAEARITTPMEATVHFGGLLTRTSEKFIRKSQDKNSTSLLTQRDHPSIIVGWGRCSA